MNHRRRDSRRSVRFWVRRSPLLLCLPSAFLFLAISASAATSSFSSQSASSIVSAARTAMIAAGSVSSVGSGPVNYPGVGRVTVSETNYSGRTSGSQIIKTTSASSAALPEASTLVVNGALYVNANAKFWSSAAGFSDAQGNLVAQRWVEIPRSNSLYKEAASDLTMSSLAMDLFDAKSYHRGPVRTVDGIRAIEITYRNSGPDSGSATAFISLGGKHLPIVVTIGSLPFQLGSWGVAKPVSAPQGSVPLSTLLTSTST